VEDHSPGLLQSVSAKQDIYELLLSELEDGVAALGEPRYRAWQVMRWVYGRGVREFAAMSDLPKSLRSALEERYAFGLPRVAQCSTAQDGVKKLLLELADRELIESVIIPARGRVTLCISSQVGCAMACAFCATARMGLRRNLRAGEIVGEVLAAGEKLDPGQPSFTNYVFMGMGEPLANYIRLRRALAIMTAPWGLGISPRRITVSTVGLAAMMERLVVETGVNLAVSLTASSDGQRDRLMPINRRFPLAALLKGCQRVALKRRQRITFEYVMLKDVNDSRQDAERVVKLLAPLRAKVNLICFNRFEGSTFEPSSRQAMERFQAILRDGNLTATIRESRGRDIAAACGQLRVEAQQVDGPLKCAGALRAQ
jgi:23S rRNA (adenine2503-C2)-methyltransferase